MNTIVIAAKTVFSSRAYLIAGAVSFAISLVLYLFTLPATFTGGQVGLVSLHFLTLRLAGLAVVMAALLALILPFIIFLIRRGQKARTATTAGGVLVGIITPLLCCSPILPIALGFVGGLFPLLGGAGGGIQGFIATHETGFFVAAILLLVSALYQNAKKICEGACCRA